MPNGLTDWQPLADDEVTLGRVWGALGVLMERTKILPDLVTHDQCGLKQAECRETLVAEARASRRRAGAKRYSALLVVLSSILSAGLAVAGGAFLLKTGG